MGWRNTNIFAWTPQDVATFLDEIGLSGLKSSVLQNSITGPQLLSMSPEEIQDNLGATSLQARKIHSELNGLGSSGDHTAAAAAATAEADLEAAQEAAAYNTAGTTGAFIDPRNPNQSLQEYYNSNQSLSGFQIGGAAAGAAAVSAGAAALYSPMGTAAAYSPPPASPTGAIIAPIGQPSGSGSYISGQQQQLVYNNGLPPAAGAGASAVPFNQQQQGEPTTKAANYLTLCRSFFIGWLILLLPLLVVALGDLGLTIYMNGKFSDSKNLPFSEWGYVKSMGVFSPHYLDGGEMFWCILFFVAQGYTILVTIILLAFLATVGRNGSLQGTKNLAFATLLLSFLGFALYTVAIVKWTYVIAVDYSFSTAFSDATIPGVAFGLEWLAVLLWLVCLILAAVQLGLLSKKKYKT